MAKKYALVNGKMVPTDSVEATNNKPEIKPVQPAPAYQPPIKEVKEEIDDGFEQMDTPIISQPQAVQQQPVQQEQKYTKEQLTMMLKEQELLEQQIAEKEQRLREWTEQPAPKNLVANIIMEGGIRMLIPLTTEDIKAMDEALVQAMEENRCVRLYDKTVNGSKILLYEFVDAPQNGPEN